MEDVKLYNHYYAILFYTHRVDALVNNVHGGGHKLYITMEDKRLI